MKKIWSNNNLSKTTKPVKATKKIINTPKIAIEKSPIVVEPNVVTSSKIATKPKIAIEKNINYNNYKNRVIKQLKKHFKKLIDVKKVNIQIMMMMNTKE